MKQILDYMPLDIVPHPDGFVIIEPDKKDQDGRLRISFWFYNLKTMVVQKVKKNFYTECKFGPAHENITRQINDYISCAVCEAPRDYINGVFPTGEIGIFDKKESLSGQMINGIPIRSSNDIEDFCRDNDVKVAILCIPYEAAKELVPTLVSSGVVGFWNFSHYNIKEDYPNVSVENVHLNDSLMTLCYQVLHENN